MVIDTAPFPLLGMIITIIAPLWLLGSRVHGCFVSQALRLDRDLALLLAGPLTSILMGFILVHADSAEGYEPDRAAEIGEMVINHAVVGFLSLVVGLVAVLLPQKSVSHLPPTKTQPKEPS